MALFRIGPVNEPASSIRGEGVYLRQPAQRDFDGWVELREKSRAFLSPWEPTWPVDDLTKTAFRRRLRRQAEEMERDEAYPFFVFRATDDVLLGGLTLGQIRRGVSQTGTLGYWMGEPYAGKGYMSRAVRATLAWGFANMRLHRIEAACLPHNDPSIRLLERCGFHREGYAQAYLRINGSWQDHLLYAILDSDPLPETVERSKTDASGGSSGRLAHLFGKRYQSH